MVSLVILFADAPAPAYPVQTTLSPAATAVEVNWMQTSYPDPAEAVCKTVALLFATSTGFLLLLLLLRRTLLFGVRKGMLPSC